MSECWNCGEETWEEKAVYDPETGYARHVCPECYHSDETIAWSKRRQL